MIIEEAIQKLEQCGIFAELVGGSLPRIIGGTSRTNELGFNVYSNSYAIYQEDDLWVVAITGPGQLDTVKQVDSLSSAVALACNFYALKKIKVNA